MSDVKRAMSEVAKKGGSGSPFSALSASECSTAAAVAATLHPFGNIDKDGRGEGSGQANGGSGKKIQTLRLELNLFEPTADSFPEFNFSKLIHEEQKRRKKSQKKQADRAGNGFLSDPDMDMDVERVAKELERKYGMGSDYASKSKSVRPSKLDYCDRGAGYDEEDSFIDNSEAYDELIPQEVETVGGGFYINSGQLEFKQLSNFERPEDAQRMPKPKKRALSTTSESSDDEEPAGEKKKTTQNTAAVQQQAQKQSEEKSSANVENQQQNQPPSRDNDKGNMVAGESNELLNANATNAEDEKSRLNGHVAKKQKIVVDNGAVGGGGGEQNRSKPSSSESGKEKANGVKGKPSTVSNNATNSTTNAQPLPTAGDAGKKEENGGMKELKTTTVKDMLRAKRDSLRKMEQEKKGRSSGSSRVSSSEAEEDGDGGGDEDDDEENGEGDDEDEEEEDEYDEEEEGGGSDKNSRESVSEVEIVSESESSHESEKDTAAARGKVANGTAEGAVLSTAGQQPPKKRKPKDCKLPDDISDQLRKDVESLKELARALAGNGKLNFFESKVAELLLRIDEGARASSTGSSTKNAVLRHLEAQLSISRQSLQLKLKKIRIRKLESKTKSVLSKLEDTISYTMPAIVAKYELDCSKANEMRAAQQAASSLPNGEKADGQPGAATPQIRNPKKKYSWNERTRNLLWELYGIRQQVFEVARSRNQTEDEVLAEFMRTKVVPLWPKGWIRYEDIHKELDRRKKALAKSQGGGVQSTVGKKSATTASPLVSPGTTIDTAALTETGMNGMKVQDGVYTPVRSTTPSSVKTVNNSKGVMDVEKQHHLAGSNTTSTVQQSG
uniref:Ubinuclein middle domain-containing protein n=1 Tax=Anopheles maculatus TaxID=74869 RepID=A0A182SH78_9DIPT